MEFNLIEGFFCKHALARAFFCIIAQGRFRWEISDGYVCDDMWLSGWLEDYLCCGEGDG